MSSTHSAVIFDMDGLLVDSEPLYMRAWQEAASQLGFEITDPPAEYIERVLLVAANLDEATPHVLRAVRFA